MFSSDEQRAHMRSLVEFTASSFEGPFPSPFGAAVYNVATGELISRDYDTVLRHSDPTNHGEINAIRLAAKRLGRLSLSGHALYSTCEPCPMCMSACIWAELDAVIYGASTLEDADRYWPQPSDLSPNELVERMRAQRKCVVIPHVHRDLCRDLFARCDEVRQHRQLQLPPNR